MTHEKPSRLVWTRWNHLRLRGLRRHARSKPMEIAAPDRSVWRRQKQGQGFQSSVRRSAAANPAVSFENSKITTLLLSPAWPGAGDVKGKFVDGEIAQPCRALAEPVLQLSACRESPAGLKAGGVGVVTGQQASCRRWSPTLLPTPERLQGSPCSAMSP